MTVTAARSGQKADIRRLGIRLTEVTRTYESGVTAVTRLSLQAAPGEVITVVGPSGCGKTTLLELVCGLQRPDEGTVEADPAALMPQRDMLLPWLSALDNAALPLRVGPARTDRRGARDAAMPWLERLGLADFAHVRPAELSGGMRQRISFVRALLTDKPLLALDEPFAALDAITRAEAQAWLVGALSLTPRTVLMVTHDVEEAVLLGDRLVVMSPRPGRITASLDITALPKPRRRSDPRVVELREMALGAMGGPR